MTLIEAINRVDALKPNSYSQEEKISWLSTLDGMIVRDVIRKYDGGEDFTFDGYTADTPLDTDLIVKEPYEEMYICWLESKIDYNNAEYARYNNSVTRYNDIYMEFARNYNRNHMPIGTAIKYF